MGHFEFDAATGTAKVDTNATTIWGFDSDKPSFFDALSKVQDSMRDHFVDMIDRQEASTLTEKVTLTNGNKVVEFYQKNYHSEDYECNSLLSIKGITRLVA